MLVLDTVSSRLFAQLVKLENTDASPATVHDVLSVHSEVFKMNAPNQRYLDGQNFARTGWDGDKWNDLD